MTEMQASKTPKIRTWPNDLWGFFDLQFDPKFVWKSKIVENQIGLEGMRIYLPYEHYRWKDNRGISGQGRLFRQNRTSKRRRTLPANNQRTISKTGIKASETHG